MATRPGSNLLLKLGGAALIVAALALALLRAGPRAPSPGEAAEALLNEGMVLHERGATEEALPKLAKGAAVAHRGAAASTDPEEQQKLAAIEAEGQFLFGALSLKHLQAQRAQAGGAAAEKTLPNIDLQEPEEALKKAVELAPSNSRAWRLLGFIERERGNLLQAATYLEKAIEQNDRFAAAHNDLGETYYKLGQYDAAERHFLRAADLDADLANAHLNLGIYYSTEGLAEKRARSHARARRHLETYLKLTEGRRSNRERALAAELLQELKPEAPRP